MSKLLHLWNSLSDDTVIRLRNESISLEGIGMIVSDDESFLLDLACAEITENVRLATKSVSRISSRCHDTKLRCFSRWFNVFADSGHDFQCWVLSDKGMEGRNKKMEKLVSGTATLCKQMEELSITENSLRKHCCVSIKEQKLIDLQQKLLWQKQEVKCLKENSLWSKSFDMVVSMLVRSVFTILQRVKLVFGLGHGYYPSSLPRSPSASATVYPTVNPNTYNFVSGPLKGGRKINFFESNSKLLKPPSSTLGASALSLHYANLIIVLEKMMNTPQLVGIEARDDLYSMLPSSIRSSLRARLKGVGFTASDPVLAGEWRVALGRILSWLSPLAHNMIKLQNERSLEHQNSLPRTNVLLLHTLFFANIDKTEAAITELLVGLNYIWRFEREMTAKVLFECS
ncbi:cleavage and polyadenylation specificity factor subunit 1-like [Hibiscus syriacus]|uniref:Cleavage and polyadenylation specificity factor subunit 1-like n=1 Tax=Hibiscus syriacus TaxID=106335 RepID=A0A6A2X4V9_HIBSY|nr:cleavage and polyadenylation specificity factor subunit 1-like [Hibiscus syriacus]